VNDTYELPSAEALCLLAEKTAAVLGSESSTYRPCRSDGAAGSLLDFVSAVPLPLIVVPDLHARVYFLEHLLSFTPPQGFFPDNTLTVLQALEKGCVRIVCVGDGLHSEHRGAQRWSLAWRDFSENVIDGTPMRQEMAEGLTLMTRIMDCKCRFPTLFHYLRGNHENIRNEEKNGFFPFYKYAAEGMMAARFMEKVYGKQVVSAYARFEGLLPLAAAFPECMITHAEPAGSYTRDMLINAYLFPASVTGLVWTANGEAADGSVQRTLENVLGKEKADKAVYFGGHRPVTGTYGLRQKGKFIQLHNPEEEHVALVEPGKCFNPDTDIVSVGI